MIRTQIYLPKQMYEKVKEQAARERKSLAEIIRGSVEDKLFLGKKGERINAGLALRQMAKRAEALDKKFDFKGPKDASVEHDKYIYASSTS